MKVSHRNKIVLVAITPMLFATIAYALTMYLYHTYSFPNNAYVNPTTSAKILIDNVAWTNGTAINWNNVTRGETYQKNMTIINNGTTPFNASIVTPNLEEGWTQTWNTTQSRIEPDFSLSAMITLIVPTTATAGLHTWNFYILIEP